MKNTHVRLLFGLTLSLSLSVASSAENLYAPDTPEPGSIEAIAHDTTEPRFMSQWVSYVPESSSVPSPTKFLGHIAGAKGELLHTQQLYSYYRELARTSKRVKVEVIGKSEEGRDILLVAISDESSIQNMDQLKAASAALADPRKTSPEQAEQIISTAKPFYYFNGAIHADESVSPDMLTELAYRLAVSETPMIQRIRKNTVVLINPVSNPDGRDKMADWFYRYLKGKTDYDTLPRQSPPYWSKYVYVDANRDAHQMSFPETRAIYKMFFDYHPIVIHDLHEAIALLQTWNGTGPYNPNLDPIVLSEFLELSFHEMSTMSSQGMPGVWTWDFGEAFGHHYTDSIAMNHNSMGRGYETFGNATAETVKRNLEPNDITREWYRPWPPPQHFVWSHRDGVNYCETGALAALDYTARNADQLLKNFYKKGYNSWQKGKSGNPYAFVIPAEQPDRRRVAQMLNRLINQKIEVSRATTSFQTKEGNFPAGTYVVRLDQPYRNYAVDLLLPQEFPNDWEHAPYDDISWALPFHYGVDVKRIDDPAVMNASLELVQQDLAPAGRVNGTGNVFVLKDVGQEAFLAARYRLAKFNVEIAEKAFHSGNTDYSAGSWILPDQAGLRAAVDDVSKELALDFDAVNSIPDVPHHSAAIPRIGIWVPWADTDMIGWIRFTLDQQKVPYTYLRDEEIKAGDLRKNVDIIIFGNVLLDLQGQILGIQRTNGPLPFKKTAETPNLGTPAESDDITGGIGWSGLANLQRFVEDGGMFITLGSASTLALDGGLVRSVHRATLADVSTPGAEILVKFTHPDHPIAYGYPLITFAFRSNYPLYDPPRRWLTMSYCTSCLDGPLDYDNVVLQWGIHPFDPGDELDTASAGERRPLVISGGGKNVDKVEGRPAILDVPEGKGHVLVYNFNPMHRDLNHSDYRFLWNGILNWDYIVNGNSK